MATVNPTINWLASLALMSCSAVLAAQQDDPQATGTEDLRERIQAAQAELAEAARRVARLQRELGAPNGEREIIRFRGDESSGVKDLSIRLDGADLDERISRHLAIAGMPPRLGVLLGGPGSNPGNEVVGLTPGGGAEAAGIARGDRLVSINGKPVVEGAPDSIREALQDVEPGATVPVVVERDEERLNFDVETRSIIRDVQVLRLRPGGDEFEREIVIMHPEDPRFEGAPKPPVPPAPPRLPLFAALGHESDLISNHAGLEPYFGTADGVVVLRIDPDNEFSLRDGDVVLRLDERQVTRPVELGGMLLSREPGEEVVFEVMREGVLTQIRATIPERSEGIHKFPMKIEIKKAPSPPNAPNPSKAPKAL